MTHFKFSLDPPTSPTPPERPGWFFLTALDGETGWVKEYVPPTHLESNHPTPKWERAYWRRRGAA